MGGSRGAQAQPIEHPADTTTVHIGFSYNYDTYVWSDSVLFRRSLGGNTSWGLDGGLSATEVSSSDGLKRKQRFVAGRVFVDHRFSSRWSGGFSLTQRRQRLEELANRHYVFSDILTQLKYSFSRYFWLAQKTGFSIAGRSTGQASTEDLGFTSETVIHLQSHHWLDRFWQSLGSLKINNLKNVPSVEGRWELSSSGGFFVGDSLSVGFADLIRNTRYYPTVDNYETVAEQELHNGHFIATASGDWGPRLYWRIATDFTWRREKYELIGDQNSAAAILPLGLRQSSRGYRMKLGSHVGSFAGLSAGYNYGESDEDFGVDVKDQDSKTGELELGGYCRLSGSDSLVARTLWKVVSFFVPPDSAFYTDRDLATRLAEISWIHQYSPSWETVLSFSYRGFRQAFISGLWSGDNNHNDIYLLEPRLRWRPAPGWQVHQTYRIQANYLSYDIEKGQPQPERSTLYRRGESETRLWLAPLVHSKIELRYTYRYEDFGPLIWREKWNQQVSWDRRSHLAGFSWRCRPYRGWELTPGLSYEEKRSYDHQEEDSRIVRLSRSTFVRRTVRFSAIWQPAGRRDDLRLSGSRRIQKSSGGMKDISDWVELAYRRYW